MARPISAGLAGLEAVKLRVWKELRAGESIIEAFINGDGNEMIYGMQEGQRVVVNPALPTVELVIHELLHRIFQRWGEKRVQNETRRIMRTLSDRDVQRWNRAYQRVRRVQKRPIEAEDD